MLDKEKSSTIRCTRTPQGDCLIARYVSELNKYEMEKAELDMKNPRD